MSVHTHRHADRANTGTMISTYAAHGGRSRGARVRSSKHASPRQSFPRRCISGIATSPFGPRTSTRRVTGHAPFPEMSAG